MAQSKEIMPDYSTTYDEPYVPEQIFDLVADVERYPEFLPWWRAARVHRRKGNVLHVDQIVGRGAVNWRFATMATMVRPERLDIVSTDWPFQHLRIHWQFTATRQGGTTISFSSTYRLRSALLERLAASLFEIYFHRFVLAFERRAHEIYGAPTVMLSV
jgi:coenzyme Q-binding protein COQ10